eukprot:1152448-Pelagomonas_calceolata.AAC.1
MPPAALQCFFPHIPPICMCMASLAGTPALPPKNSPSNSITGSKLPYPQRSYSPDSAAASAPRSGLA